MRRRRPCFRGDAFDLEQTLTKATNLGALKIVLGMKSFILYLFFTMAFAAISGLLTDLLI